MGKGGRNQFCGQSYWAEPYEITHNTYTGIDVEVGIDDIERNKDIYR